MGGLTKAKRGPKAGPITKSSKERKKNYPLEIQLFFYPLIALINLTSEDWSICGKLHLGPKMWLFAGIIIWQKLIYIGRLEYMWETASGAKNVAVRWYYHLAEVD